MLGKWSKNSYENIVTKVLNQKICSRTLIDRARVECQNHWFVYNERMSVESCAQAVSTLAIQFGDSDDGGSAMSRPFGVAILFAGVESGDPQLWHMDPSGTYIRYDAKAIGSGSEGAQQNLQVKIEQALTHLNDVYNDCFSFTQDNYTPNMTITEAVNLSLRTLKQVMEEKLNSTNVEVMIMTPDNLFQMYSKAEVEKIIADLQ